MPCGGTCIPIPIFPGLGTSLIGAPCICIEPIPPIAFGPPAFGLFPFDRSLFLMGDLGRSPSISPLVGTTAFPEPLAFACARISPSHNSRSHATPPTRASSIGGLSSVPRVTHPLRREDARPNISRRRVPRQKFSISECISGGFRRGSRAAGELRLEVRCGGRDVPAGSPSQIITSVSREYISSKRIGDCKISHQCCNGRTSRLSSVGPSLEYPSDNVRSCA